MVKNILFVGVGGQGTILASKILVEGLLQNNYDVKMTEVHGMAQRGGSVTTEVRFGDKVFSPLIERGNADVIVAFEKSETCRWLSYLKKDGDVIVNNLEIMPLTVNIGIEKYEENISEELRKNVENIKEINALDIAESIGNSKVQNIVILGALIKTLKLEYINWNNIIKKHLPIKVHDININAFNKGLEV